MKTQELKRNKEIKEHLKGRVAFTPTEKSPYLLSEYRQNIKRVCRLNGITQKQYRKRKKNGESFFGDVPGPLQEERSE